MKKIITSSFLIALFAISMSANAQSLKADFATSTNYGCTGKILKLINNSTGADSFYWEVKSKNLSSFDKNWDLIVNDIEGTVEDVTVTLYAFKLNEGRDTILSESTKSRTVKIEINPTAIFNADSILGTAAWFYHDAKNYTSMSWDFDDPDSESENIKYTDSKPIFHLYTKGGKFYPKLVVSSNNDCKDTFTMEIMIYDSLAGNSIIEQIPFDFSLYPNPININTTFKADLNNNNHKLWLTDIQGKVIWNANKQSNIINEPIGLILENQPNGTYILHLSLQEKLYIFKIYK